MFGGYDTRACAGHGIDKELTRWATDKVGFHCLSRAVIGDAVYASDIQCNMRPAAGCHAFNNLTGTIMAFDE